MVSLVTKKKFVTRSRKQRRKHFVAIKLSLATKCFRHCFKNQTGPAGLTGSTGSQSGPVKTPQNRSKIEKPVKNREKTGVEPEIKKKKTV